MFIVALENSRAILKLERHSCARIEFAFSYGGRAATRLFLRLLALAHDQIEMLSLVQPRCSEYSKTGFIKGDLRTNR